MTLLNNFNFRPLLLSKTQIQFINNFPGFHEVAFYVSFHKIGPTEPGIYTLRIALKDKDGKIINFGGKPNLPPAFPASGEGIILGPYMEFFSESFSTIDFKNSGIYISMEGNHTYYDSAIGINREEGTSYFTQDIYSSFSEQQTHVLFYLESVFSMNTYHLKFRIISLDGGFGGPLVTNTKPA